MLTLVIGNKNYSSWSLRAWLFLRQSGIPFDEERIPMFTGNWHQKVLSRSPAGRVPVLIDGEITVWDSLAIMQYVGEKYPDAAGWPKDDSARAHARSVSAEMHSGFIAIRDELPQNIRLRAKLDQASLSPACQDQISRVVDIWADCASRYGTDGRWLFGDFCIADVMYAPVALRFLSYGIEVPRSAMGFVEAVAASPVVREWCDAAAEESERLDFIDELVSAASSPLTLG